MGFLLDPHGFNPSPFETAITAEGPIFHARFRDGDFTSVIADSSGNNRDLVKQIAAATRSSVATRTTHPGGALFPSVAYDDWANDGTFYKRAAESLLSGATEYTALISFRMIKAPSNTFQKAFGLGIENVAETGDNDLAFFKASANSPTLVHHWKNRYSGALIPANFEVTEKLEDGVNRLATVRFDSGTLFRLMTSKPGHEGLVEDTAGNSGPLKALSRALILNARSETNTGTDTTLEMVVDQIALFDTDIGATAEADLHSKWMDEVAGAGYYPSMMEHDGSSYYQKTSVTASGNAGTFVALVDISEGTGGSFSAIAQDYDTGDAQPPIQIGVWDGDHANAALQNKLGLICKNAAGTNLCLLISSSDVGGAGKVLIFAAFDATAGTAILRIDGVDEDDTGHASRVAPTAGTLPSGTDHTVTVAANEGGLLNASGKIGEFGFIRSYLTNYDDFGTAADLAAIDEKDWTEFGSSQPLVFAHDGDLENNKGSAGDFTKNGTITRTTGGSP